MSRATSSDTIARRERLRAFLDKSPATAPQIRDGVAGYDQINHAETVRGDCVAIGAVKSGGKRGAWSIGEPGPQPKAAPKPGAKPRPAATAPVLIRGRPSLADFETRELLEELINRDAALLRALRGR